MPRSRSKTRTPKCQLILSTAPNVKVARRIARALVEERLAACVNIVAVRDSIYRWRGKVESAREALLVIKARAADRRRIETRLHALHPYELPEFLVVPVAGGSRRYLNWVTNPDKAS